MAGEKQAKGRHGPGGSMRTIAVGFAAMLILMLALAAGWLISMQRASERLHHLAAEYENAMNVVAMRDAAQGRMLSLSRMAMTQDPFKRDQEFIEFSSMGNDFVAARERMLAAGLDPEEEKMWTATREMVRRNAIAQTEVVALLENGEHQRALERIDNDASITQKSIHAELKGQQALMQGHVRAELVEASSDGRLSAIAATILGASALVLGALVMWLVMRRSGSAERALVQAREDAQRANRLKSQFLANMSHEIRTPLTAIIGFAETLVAENQPKKARQEAVRAIYRGGKHLLHVVNDILDVSKIEAGQMQVEHIEFAPHEVVREVVRLSRARAEGKGILLDEHYQLPLPAAIRSDPVRFEQILFNLVSNAIKFTEKGNVSITLGHDPQPGQLSVTVSDSGIGMTPEEASRVFAPFVQADASTTRKYGGTGLGLSIAKSLARLLGGDLRCESVKDKGTVFTLTIATGTASAARLIENEDDLSASAQTMTNIMRGVPQLGGRVLLAEDTPENQQLVTRYVERTGAAIDVAGDGQQAIDRAMAEHYDLVLMDMQMPVLGGLDATAVLREKGYRQPVVAITANVMPEDRARYTAAGIADMIEKPFNTEKLYALLARYLPPVSRDSIAEPVENYSDVEDIRMRFIERLPGIVQILRDSMPNWATLESEVHQLKGLGASLGFPEISRVAVPAHDAIRLEDHEFALAQLAELVRVIEQELGKLTPAGANRAA